MAINTKTNITINGKNYNSLDEVGEDYRDLLKDENGNGIPDAVEAFIDQAKKTGTVNKQFSFNVSSNKSTVDEPVFDVTKEENEDVSVVADEVKPTPIIISDSINRKALIILAIIAAVIAMVFWKR